MAEDKGIWRDLSEGFKAGLPEGRKWKTAGEQEDWLRTKGKLLGYTTEVLANRLRDEFPTLPAQVIRCSGTSRRWPQNTCVEQYGEIQRFLSTKSKR